jgi:parallel beta-helix repeat protein
MSGSLSFDEKNNVTLRGAGEGKTILSFMFQKQGAEGLRVTNSSNIVLEKFTIEDSKGDLIKTQNVAGITFRNITAQWTGKPRSSNGSYALYPVQCSRVIIEQCTAIGASDAGIYVGQSDSVWVRNCVARHNVAGIEIENTTNAWVHNNLAEKNTGGILVFDLPDLPKKRGGFVQVYDNKIVKNNHKNFAPKGNIVGKVPAGTGVMILASNDVEIFRNEIENHKTASTAIVSYLIAETPIKDSLYNPYPARITVRDNIYLGKKRIPTFKNKMGILFFFKFGRKVPKILYDGAQNPAWTDTNGHLKPEYRICIGQNVNGSFANLKITEKFNVSRDLEVLGCK